MKLNFVILLSAALASSSAYSQTGGGTGAGATSGGGVSGNVNGTAGQGAGASGGVSTSTSTSAGGVSGGATSPGGASSSTSSSTSGGVRVTPQPLLPGGPPTVQAPNPNPPVRELLKQPPGATVNPQLRPTNGPIGVNPNQPIDTNTPILMNANQASATNQIGGQTQGGAANPGLTPTSGVGITNRILSTNTAGIMTNANPALMHDQALSEGDRRLLFQLRAAVFGPNQAAAPSGSAPVHFILRDGAVRLVGIVSSEQERQRIESVAQQVPGVVRVFNALQISQTGTQPAGTPPAAR